MKPVIGILSSLKINDENKPYDNYYKIIGLYVNRIKELGGIPIGILSLDDIDVLNLCDGFIMPGGIKVTKDHYKLIEYVIKNNKPGLGICAGMQAMIMYDYLFNECLKEKDTVNVEDIYNKHVDFRKEKISILKKVNNHGGELVTEEIESTNSNISKSTHLININKDSILYDIYKCNIMSVISMHNYGVYKSTNLFKVIAKSRDNVVEAIQYKDKFIIGVQFHIELEKDNLIIKRFIEECKK